MVPAPEDGGAPARRASFLVVFVVVRKWLIIKEGILRGFDVSRWMWLWWNRLRAKWAGEIFWEKRGYYGLRGDILA